MAYCNAFEFVCSFLVTKHMCGTNFLSWSFTENVMSCRKSFAAWCAPLHATVNIPDYYYIVVYVCRDLSSSGSLAASSPLLLCEMGMRSNHYVCFYPEEINKT